MAGLQEAAQMKNHSSIDYNKPISTFFSDLMARSSDGWMDRSIGRPADRPIDRPTSQYSFKQESAYLEPNWTDDIRVSSFNPDHLKLKLILAFITRQAGRQATIELRVALVSQLNSTLVDYEPAIPFRFVSVIKWNDIRVQMSQMSQRFAQLNSVRLDASQTNNFWFEFINIYNDLFDWDRIGSLARAT